MTQPGTVLPSASEARRRRSSDNQTPRATGYRLEPVRADRRVPEMILSPGRHTLGSATDCEFRIDVPGVRPQHCLLLVGSQSIVVQATDPRTWLNDGPVSDSPLSPGDRLTVGPIELRLTTFQMEPEDARERSNASTELPPAEPTQDSTAVQSVERLIEDIDSLVEEPGLPLPASAATSPEASTTDASIALSLRRREGELARLMEEFLAAQSELGGRAEAWRRESKDLKSRLAQQGRQLSRRQTSLEEQLAELDAERNRLSEQHAAQELRQTELLSEAENLLRQREQLDTARQQQSVADNDLAEREAEMRQLSETFKEKQEALDRLKHDLKERVRAADLRAHELTARATELADREVVTERLVSQRHAELDERARSVATLSARAETERQQLDAALATLNADRETLAVEQERHALAMNDFATQQDELDAARQELAQRETQLAEDATALSQRNKELNLRQADLEAREASLDEDRATLAANAQQLAADRVALHERTQSVANAEHAVEIAEQQRIAAECELAWQFREAEWQTLALSLTDAQLADRSAEISDRLRAAEADLAEMAAQQVATVEILERSEHQRERIGTVRRRLSMRAAHLRQAADSQQTQATELRTERESLDHRLAAVQARVAAVRDEQTRLAAERLAVDELREATQRQATSLTALKRDFSTRVARSEQRETAIAQREDELSLQLEKLEARQAELDASDSRLSIREEDLRRQRSELSEREVCITEERNSLDQRQAELDQLAADLADRRADLDDRTSRLAARPSASVEQPTDEQPTAAQHAFEKLQSERESLRKQLDALESEQATWRREATGYRQECESLERQCERLQEQLEAALANAATNQFRPVDSEPVTPKPIATTDNAIASDDSLASSCDPFNSDESVVATAPKREAIAESIDLPESLSDSTRPNASDSSPVENTSDEDPAVLQLRQTLSNLFRDEKPEVQDAVTNSEAPDQYIVEAEVGSPAECSLNDTVDVDAPELVFDDLEEIWQAADPREEEPQHEEAAESVSVSDYMEQLLARLRQSGHAPATTDPPAKPAAPPKLLVKAAPVEPKVTVSAAPVDRLPKVDKDVLRAQTDSLRAVANRSARAAIAVSDQRRQRTDLIARSLMAAAAAGLTMFLITLGLMSNSNYLWLALFAFGLAAFLAFDAFCVFKKYISHGAVKVIETPVTSVEKIEQPPITDGPVDSK